MKCQTECQKKWCSIREFGWNRPHIWNSQIKEFFNYEVYANIPISEKPWHLNYVCSQAFWVADILHVMLSHNIWWYHKLYGFSISSSNCLFLMSKTTIFLNIDLETQVFVPVTSHWIVWSLDNAYNGFVYRQTFLSQSSCFSPLQWQDSLILFKYRYWQETSSFPPHLRQYLLVLHY